MTAMRQHARSPPECARIKKSVRGARDRISANTYPGAPRGKIDAGCFGPAVGEDYRDQYQDEEFTQALTDDYVGPNFAPT
jgi:hypothetical protein